MSARDLTLRDPTKGFEATVVRLPKNLDVQKTLTVEVVKRLYLKKYKRFYRKSYRYHVHCDLKNPEFNPAKVSKINLNDKIFCTYTRRISRTKNAVVYLNDPKKQAL